MLVELSTATVEYEVRAGEVSGGVGAVVVVSDDMTGAAVMVRGVEVVTDKLVAEDKVEFVVVRGGKGVETPASQENQKIRQNHKVPTSLKGATCSIFLPTMMTT